MENLNEPVRTGRIVVGDIGTFLNGSAVKNLCRENEFELILNSVNSFISEKRPENLFIYGRNGTGKTECIRHVVSILNANPGVILVHVNCHENQTKTAVFSRIASELGNVFSVKGFASYEIFSKIRELIEKENKRIVLVLDDFDAIDQNDIADLFYPIIEMSEVKNDSFSVLLVCDDFETFDDLDPKIKSALMFRVIEFEPYSKEKISEILANFANVSLETGSYTQGVLDRIAEIGVSAEGNLRFSIKFLVETAKNAEQRSSGKIEDHDVLEVYGRLLPLGIFNSGNNGSELSEEESLIIDILKLGEMQTSQIYEFFIKKTDRSKRQVRNYLVALVSKGYLDYEVLESTSSQLKPKLYRLKKR